MSLGALFITLILYESIPNLHGFWFFDCPFGSGKGGYGSPCSYFCQCRHPYVCQIFTQRCVKAAVYREACYLMKPCEKGLSCHPGYQQCFHSPRRILEPCAVGFPCMQQHSCHPGIQKCYHHPRLYLEPCSLGFPCKEGLSCHPGKQICYHSPRKHLEPCSLFFGCESGMSCQPGIQQCFNSPRQYLEPCSAFYGCRKGLSCHPGVQVCHHSPRQEGEPCSAGFSCSKGLRCSECASQFLVCERDEVEPFQEEDYDRPYNKVAFLVTHNSFSYGEKFAPWVRNQDRTIGQQLQDGVRGFMLDVHQGWGDDEVRLCHETCLWGGSENVLNDLIIIRKFLDNNPNEIVTIILEDYIRNSLLMTKILDEADITRHVLHFRYWGNETTSWPTLREMRYLGRLVLFSSASRKRFPYVNKNMWFYLRENRYGSKSKDVTNCKDRRESRMNVYSYHWTLVLINWFDTVANALDQCLNDFDRIQMKLKVCSEQFDALPNFLAVDYYERGKHGGAFKAVQWLNERWRETSKIDLGV